ncbi:MAG: response regulator [Deltaproteobacteria bacterium]|nr:response regulator [Deltaproteobacteria bacterium]MBN2674537.1 response regulator [Deltaproteobacteria bacterium]
MNWLFPSILASLSGTALLAVTFLLIYRAEKQKFLVIWSAGWVLYAIRFGFMLWYISQPPSPFDKISLLMNQLCSLYSGIFLLWGAYDFLGRRLPFRLKPLAILFSLYTIFWVIEFSAEFIWSLPVFFFLGAIYIWTGVIFIRADFEHNGYQKILGILFIVWGLHKIDYPFARGIDSLAPWGYLLGAMLELLTAVFMILMFFQKVLVNRDSYARTLEKERYFLKRAQEMGHLGTWEMDVEKNDIQWTEENYRIFGLPIGTPLSYQSFIECVHPDDREYVNAQWQRALNNQPYDIEHRVLTDDGTKWVREKAELHFNESGTCVSAIGFTHDITQQKTAAQEKEKLHIQLAQAQKIETIGSLAGGIAHDFNNLLGVILGNAELALSDVPDNHPQTRLLEGILDAAERSAALTRQLLGFARQQPITPKVLDLNTVIEQMLRVLRRLLGEEIELAWHPGRNLRMIRMDPTQIDQIMTNLCANARDAIDGIGRVEISTQNFDADASFFERHVFMNPLSEGIDSFVKLVITDSGSGMDENTLNRLFEPFFTTKELGKGTGLGLSTVHGIIMQNQGHIEVDSVENQGTSFSLYLPQYVVHSPTVSTKSNNVDEFRGQEVIFVVEDDEAMKQMLSSMLENQGYTVYATTDPTNALQTARNMRCSIDLLVCDVIMPGLSGQEVVTSFRSAFPQIKYLYMSGYPADIIGRRGVLDEGVPFISKPFSSHDFAKKVREVLDTK